MQLVWYILKQLFTSVSVKVVDIYLGASRLGSRLYLRATREKMASRFASMASEEIIQINDEAVPENPRKTTNFGLAVFRSNDL